MTDPIVLQSTGNVTGPASSTDNSMVLFSGTSGKVIKGNNAVVTAAGLALLDDNNNTEQRNTLGLGTIATQNSNAVTISGGTITGITDITIADGGTGASTAAAARTNLGLGTMATQNSNAVAITGGTITGITDISIADGGTGASDAGTARSNLGLGTMATQNASYVGITGGDITNLNTLTVGTASSWAPTAAFGTNNGQLANTNFVQGAVSDRVPNGRYVWAGPGITGGGYLSVDIPIVLGTPSSISVNTGNSLYDDSHTHYMDMASFFSTYLDTNGYVKLPGGLIIQWGTSSTATASESLQQNNFTHPFPNACLMVVVGTRTYADSSYADGWAQIFDWGTYYFRWRAQSTVANFNSAVGCTFVAFGY